MGAGNRTSCRSIVALLIEQLQLMAVECSHQNISRSAARAPPSAVGTGLAVRTAAEALSSIGLKLSRGTVSSTIATSALRKSVKACQGKSAELLTVSSLARARRTLARSCREKAVIAVKTFRVHALQALGVDS